MKLFVRFKEGVSVTGAANISFSVGCIRWEFFHVGDGYVFILDFGDDVELDAGKLIATLQRNEEVEYAETPPGRRAMD